MSARAAAINVAVIGTGYFGGGLLRRLIALDRFTPRVAANRTVGRAVAAFRRAGVPQDELVITDDVQTAQDAIQAGRYVATANLLLPTALSSIEVIAEATGDLLVGTEVALATIEAGKHLVAANSDVQATVGPMLKVLADRAGVVYTDIEGDEPGLLTYLIDYAQQIGLNVLVAGNGKGVLKRYATPDTQAAFAAEYGLQPWLATAAADGTKLNFEMTVVANATGFLPAVPGMHGPAVNLADSPLTFSELGAMDGGRYVDYILGARGVFVILRSEDAEIRSDFRYLKLGDGPFYILHRPEVLAHYAAPLSIDRAARRCESTVTPAGAPVAETIAFAKRDLTPGQKVDGIGGFDLYGLIVRADHAHAEDLLPIGIAGFARVRRAVRKDKPLTYSDVEFQIDNVALNLHRTQRAFFL